MAEWIGVGAAIEKLKHLGPAKAQAVLIERAMAGKLPARAALFRKMIEYDPLDQHLDGYRRYVRENPNVTAPYIPAIRSGSERYEVEDSVLDASFFTPAFAQAVSMENEKLGAEANWRSGDFKRVEMDGYDRVTVEAVAVQFKAAMIEALAPPMTTPTAASRQRSGPPPTYGHAIGIGALLAVADLDNLPGGRGAQAKMIDIVLAAHADRGEFPDRETIRKRVKRWMEEAERHKQFRTR